MESPLARFHIVSGKGGVGKSTYSAALVKKLHSQGRKVRYVHLSQTSIDHNGNAASEQSSLFAASEFNLYLDLNLKDAVTEYIESKLRSHTIAKWIAATSFFKALFNMLPSFGHLIYLGKLLELLKADSELIIVLDAPSSGHLVTMFESIKNFSQIFQSGLVFEDTLKIINLLYSQDFHQFHLITLPTEMSMVECLELKEQLIRIDNRSQIKIVLNNSLSALMEVDQSEMPNHLNAKLSQERILTDQYQNQIMHSIKHVDLDNYLEIVKAVEAQL